MFKTLIGTALLVGCLAGCSGATTPLLTPVTVYEGDADYKELTEPESPWYGTLKEVTEDSYVLVYGNEEQALYTRGAETRLEPFVDHKVIVTGKLAEAAEGTVLWPAAIEVHTDGFLACSKLIPQLPVEEKIASQHLKKLLAEQHEKHVEPIGISFCDDQTITPDSTMEQLEVLRASAFAMLSQELKPLLVSIRLTSWLTGGIHADMQLGDVLKLAERADVIGIISLNETAPPP